jgi:hypothetical protein
MRSRLWRSQDQTAGFSECSVAGGWRGVERLEVRSVVV